MGTVVAAVIGAVVGSLGGAYLGVAVGADRDDERADREFWRTQRISIYADFLAAAEESRDIMEGYLLDAEDHTTMWDTLTEYPEPPEDLLADIEESIRRVDTLAGQISFIGEDVAPLAQQIHRELDGVSSLIRAVAQCRSDDTIGGLCNSTVDDLSVSGAKPDWASLRQFKSHRDSFLQAAQEQLDAPD